MNVARNYVKYKFKLIFLVVSLTLVVSGCLAYSKFYDQFIFVTAQNVPTLTVSVEKFTQNHLPNITGNCVVGDNLLFTIKKGNTGVVSETFNKLCDASPYSTNPTISLPDGKYKVSVVVSISVCIPAVNTTGIVNGTTGNNTLRGTIDNNTIYGNGGNDRIFGAAGNDMLLAGNPTNSTSGITSIFGDGGCDTLIGGTGSTTLNGSNDTLNGVAEQDILIGGTGINTFYLGNGTASYYVGNNDSDYAEIRNFRCPTDKIRLSSSPSSYIITYVGTTANIYKVVNGNQDLVAKIINAPANLALTGGPCFDYATV